MTKYIYAHLKECLTQKQIDKFDIFYNALDATYQQELFIFSLNYTINKNKEKRRKLGQPNVLHALKVALKAIDYNLNYLSVCGALLHDVVEDSIEDYIKNHAFATKEEKTQKRLELRQRCFDEFVNDIMSVTTNEKAKDDITDIIALVNMLTRYKDDNPDYLYYIKTSFGSLNIEDREQLKHKALLIKYLDRADNITTMDTQLKKIINKKIKSELKILDLLPTASQRKKYKETLLKQNAILLDQSFGGCNRLNQIWKNTLVLIKGRMLFCHYNSFIRDNISIDIESEIIEKTLNAVINHKNALRIHLNRKQTDLWDNNAKMYKKIGGFSGKTKEFTGQITEDNAYLIFNTTLETFSKLLLKNTQEFIYVQNSYIAQYQYLALIFEMLTHFQENPDFICNLSKYVILEDTKKTPEICS